MRAPSPLLLASLACLSLSLGVPGVNQAEPPSQPISPPATRVAPDAQFIRYTLKAGTPLQVLLQTPVDTAANQPDDPVEGIMFRDLYLGDELVLSRNTRFTGRISRLEPPVQGRDAILAVRFTEILLDNGEKLPIEAHVATEHPEHYWGGMATPGTKPMLSTQHVYGIGDYNRVVYGGPRAMGAQIHFLPGEHWTLILEQPLTLVKATDD